MFQLTANCEDLRSAASVLPESIRGLLPSEGFIRDYVEYAFPLTDAPAASHLASAFVMISGLVGTKVSIPFGPIHLYLVIWAVIIGLSSYARKTTAQRIGSDLLREVDPSVVLPSDTTPQALFDLLVQQPTRVLFLPEFAYLLQQLELKFNAGMKVMMTDLFDVPPILQQARATGGPGALPGGRNRQVRLPFLTIQTATTAAWLNAHLIDADLVGGFHARFSYWPAFDKGGRRLAIPPVPEESARLELIAHAKALAALQGTLGLDLVRRQYDEWHEAHADAFEKLDDRERLGPFWVRLETYCLKFAALYQISVARVRNSPLTEIEPWALELAIRLTDFLQQHLIRLFREEIAPTRFIGNQQKLLALLRASSPMKKRDLQRRCGLEPKDFLAAYIGLQQDGRIDEKAEKTPSGQKTFIVSLTIS
jgi:hypothetical protein